MLDIAAARAVSSANLLADVVHSQLPWSISIGQAVSPCWRICRSDRVILRAYFSPQCWLEGEPLAQLLHDDVVRSVQPVQVSAHPRGFIVNWELAVSELTSVSA